MANKGFALYRRDDGLYVLSVAYEYADTRFVGFDEMGVVFKISKLDETQKDWLRTHDPKKYDKTKNVIFFGDYYAKQIMFQNFPKGKPYSQLPGGGGVYKETRKCNSVYDLFKNDTILRAIEKYGIFGEGYKVVKELVKEEIAKMLKQESPKVAFTAVSIEEESERNKINVIYNSLVEKGVVPGNFIRPAFKGGELDYHMTIKLGELPVMFKRDLDKDVVLNITTIGVSDEAVALGVSGDYFSSNEHQHITLAFKTLPESSKHIRTWNQIEKPLQVNGIIREFSQKKEVIARGVFENPVEESNQLTIGNFQAQAIPAGRSSMFPQEKF